MIGFKNANLHLISKLPEKNLFEVRRMRCNVEAISCDYFGT
jgi:hypothetical protein